MTNLDSILKSRDIANKDPSSQGCGFSNSHVWMWELDCKKSWVLKNWCFWTVMLEKTLEGPLDCKEIQPVHPKGDQPWIFIGRTDVEAEVPILWPPDAKSWLIGKDPDAGKDWRWEEKGNDRRWEGWMASLTQWTWVWVKSRSWWWIGRPDVLQSMGLQRIGHDWATELNWIDWTPSTHWILMPEAADLGRSQGKQGQSSGPFFSLFLGITQVSLAACRLPAPLQSCCPHHSCRLPLPSLI